MPDLSDLSDHLAVRGVTRRDFLAFCGSIAVLMGLGEAAAPDVARAVSGPRLPTAVWLNLGSCTGCTESLAQSDSPDVASIVLDVLSLDYAETLMAAAGSQAEQALKRAIGPGGHIAIVEGAVMTGEGGNVLRIAGRPGTDLLREVCADARWVIAVGSCAVDGGWVKAKPNPAGAKGVIDELPALRERLINIPTCPANPEWIVATLVSLLMLGKPPELDAERRPSLMFGSTIHDLCPRRGHFNNGEFVERFGYPEERLGWCLYKMGCKGPTTLTNCPTVRWNRRVSWCVESGSPCIGCGSPNWVDANAPFRLATKAVQPGMAGVKPENVAQILAAGTAGAFAVWGVVETARGRMRDEDDTPETGEGDTTG